MEKNIVSQLLRGSQAIDQMRKEIENIIKMVLGMVADDIGPAKDFKDKNFFGEKTNWRLDMSPNGELEVLCWVKPNICGETVYSSKKNFKMDLWDVQKVHAGLSVFVEGMAQEYHRLPARWNKFLDAAEYLDRQ